MRLFLKHGPGTRNHYFFIDPPPWVPMPDASLDERRKVANKRRARQVRISFKDGFADVADDAVEIIRRLVDDGICHRPAEAAG